MKSLIEQTQRSTMPKPGERQDRISFVNARRVKPSELRAMIRRGKARVAKNPDRVFAFTASTERVDRMGDIVRQKWDLKNFKANPVILLGHNPDEIIGRSLMEEVVEHKSGAATILWVEFATKDHNPKAEQAYRMTDDGFLNAGSVGFMGLDVYEPKDEAEREALGLGPWGVEFRKNELVEFSLCSVPANPDALVNGTKMLVAKGYTQEEIAMAKRLIVKDDGEPVAPPSGEAEGEADLATALAEHAAAAKAALEEMLAALDAEGDDSGEGEEEASADDEAEEREIDVDGIRERAEAANVLLDTIVGLTEGEMDEATTADAATATGEAMVLLDEILDLLSTEDDEEGDEDSSDDTGSSDDEEEEASKGADVHALRRARRRASNRSGNLGDLLLQIKSNFEVSDD